MQIFLADLNHRGKIKNYANSEMAWLSSLSFRLGQLSLRKVASSPAAFCKPSISGSSSHVMNHVIASRTIWTTASVAYPVRATHHRPRYTKIGGAGKIVDGTEDPNP